MRPIALLADFGNRSAALARAVVPDPFVIAILLSGAAFLIGLASHRAGPATLAASFAAGMFEPGLLAFGFQMALVLLTGHALASAPGATRTLEKLAALPRSTPAAAALVALGAMLLGLLNWGLGLIGGAFLAREVGRAFARRAQPLNYPLVGAAGYMGLLVWHGGLSGSAPLKVATDGAFGPAIDIRHTLFSSLNFAVTGALLVLVPLLLAALGTAAARTGAAPAPWVGGMEVEEPTDHERERGAVGWLERSTLVAAILVAPIAVALGYGLWSRGTGAINLDWVILAFWGAGLVLHAGPMAYARAFAAGARGAAGILLQFPLYFGTMAVMRDSGALSSMAEGLAALARHFEGVISLQGSAGLATFFSAAVINLFVPSGGGQWALQSPIILETSSALGLDRARMVMAFAYGDQLTNMLQPFWALPLLAITGLKAGDVMGYTIIAMLAAVPVIALGLVVG